MLDREDRRNVTNILKKYLTLAYTIVTTALTVSPDHVVSHCVALVALANNGDDPRRTSSRYSLVPQGFSCQGEWGTVQARGTGSEVAPRSSSWTKSTSRLSLLSESGGMVSSWQRRAWVSGSSGSFLPFVFCMSSGERRWKKKKKSGRRKKRRKNKIKKKKGKTSKNACP